VTRDRLSGALLIACALAGVAVMGLHPTPHDVTGTGAAGQLHLSVIVHGLAIATVPALFLGLLGLWRRLGGGEPGTAALVTHGFALIAETCAAVASGFVATPLLRRIAAAPEDARQALDAQLLTAGLLNQGFAKTYLVASSVAIVLWSLALFRSGGMPRAAGAAGVLVGGAVLAAFFAGALHLDVHGFGAMTLLQSLWLLWVGVALLRPPAALGAA
jgi:hypothetical protein